MSDSLQPHGLQNPGFPVLNTSRSLLKLMSIESVMPSNHLILFCPLPLLPAIFLSVRVFANLLSPSPQATKILKPQLQHQSFQWIFRVDFLQDWLVWSPCCPRDSQQFKMCISDPAPPPWHAVLLLSWILRWNSHLLSPLLHLGSLNLSLLDCKTEKGNGFPIEDLNMPCIQLALWHLKSGQTGRSHLPRSNY